MARKDPRFDFYIAKAEPFAQPILKWLRKVVHAGCPDVQETIKWSMPHFEYKGPLCGMAAFKQHCSFGFWKASLVLGTNSNSERDGMGHFGRITSMNDLPNEKKLLAFVRKAAALNEAGIKKPREQPRTKFVPLLVPDFFTAALRKNKKAHGNFEKFSSSKRREYVEWLTEAKRAGTRQQRLATAVTWIAEGKTRNWKYEAK